MANPYEMYMLQQHSLLGELERLQALKRLASRNYAPTSQPLLCNFEIPGQQSLSRNSTQAMLRGVQIPMNPLYLGSPMNLYSIGVPQKESHPLVEKTKITALDFLNMPQRPVHKEIEDGSVKESSLTSVTEPDKKKPESASKTDTQTESSTDFSKKRKRRTAAEISREYTCPVPDCHKSYGSTTSLKAHIKLKHTGAISPPRSERMGYFHIVMPRENAWEIMNEIGELSAVQLVDLNEHEQILTRPYSTHIKRCEEMELKVQSIEQSMIRFKKPIQRCDSVKAYLKSLRDFLATRNRAEHTYFEDVEAELEEKLVSLTNQIKYYDSAVEDYNRLVENIHLLEKTSMYFGQDAQFQGQNIGGSDEESSRIGSISSRDIKFCYLAGVIDRVDSQRFRRMLFRATLGMVWSVLIDIEQQLDNPDQPLGENLVAGSKDEKSLKSIFVIAYPGGAQDVLKNRLNKISDSFGAHKYTIPEDNQGFTKKIFELKRAREDAARVLEVTRNHIDMVLETFSQPRLPNETWSMVEGFRLFVLKEKTIYHNLNMLKLQNTIYHGNCWCPIELESQVREALDNIPKRKPHIAKPEFQFADPPENAQPPTFFKTNEFTAPFQEIVNTYGIPRYREVNPGLFTIATFPFLFGVMFGDIGHGGLIFLFGLYLCFQKDEIQRQKNAFVTFLPGRYLLTMMGFFALYCGFIYNDFMAVPLNIFGSCYQEQSGTNPLVKTNGCVYPFGLDPEWYHKTNELTFFNSFKMKMAVILGISQMLLGTMLKMLNAIHFRSALDFFFEWVPQICFLCSTFGYMVVLIFIKWATPYNVTVPTSQAPAIINIFIKFILSGGAFDVGQSPNIIKPLYGDDQGNTQSQVQLALLLIALVCVPLMLFPKPLILAFGQKKNSQTEASFHFDKKVPLLGDYSKDEIQYSKDDEHKEIEPLSIEIPEKKSESSHNGVHEGSHGHEDEGFGDLFVHQLIETIEFVLGSLSHTASYLRLWALSLAHSQLAKVFFDNTIGSAITSGNFFTAFIGFAIFAQVTFGVLLCMDLMECFLHALRLHWVEFQSKFFKADGVIFDVFSFETSLKSAAKE